MRHITGSATDRRWHRSWHLGGQRRRWPNFRGTDQVLACADLSLTASMVEPPLNRMFPDIPFGFMTYLISIFPSLSEQGSSTCR